MNPHHIALVKSSWKEMPNLWNVGGEMFYAKLFALDPSLRSLFRSDIAQQGAKLMSAIDMAVAGLDHPEKLIPVVVKLGSRHQNYGISPKDYDTVAQALMATLQMGLRAKFTDEVREAWSSVYQLLANTMQGAGGLDHHHALAQA